jgi:hypothetical protein
MCSHCCFTRHSFCIRISGEERRGSIKEVHAHLVAASRWRHECGQHHEGVLIGFLTEGLCTKVQQQRDPPFGDSSKCAPGTVLQHEAPACRCFSIAFVIIVIIVIIVIVMTS